MAGATRLGNSGTIGVNCTSINGHSPLIGRRARRGGAGESDRGFSVTFGGPRPLQAGARTNIRLMFQAMVTRLHSPRAFASPRIEN